MLILVVEPQPRSHWCGTWMTKFIWFMLQSSPRAHLYPLLCTYILSYSPNNPVEFLVSVDRVWGSWSHISFRIIHGRVPPGRYSRSRTGDGRFRSYLEPAAVSLAFCTWRLFPYAGETYLRGLSGEYKGQGASSSLAASRSRSIEPMHRNQRRDHLPVANWWQTLWCRGSVTLRLASNSERIYIAWPRHRCRWTAQSSASFNERR